MENVSGSRIEISASSVIGTRRKQQDSYVYFRTDKGSLACVCDGMGGLSGGERSSALCTRMLAEDFLREAPLCAPSDFFGWESDKLDEAVSSLRTEAGEPLGSGTTIVAVYLEEKDDRYNMSWLSVGDSRIYVLRNGHIDCIVREHNYRAVLNTTLKSYMIVVEQMSQDGLLDVDEVKEIGKTCEKLKDIITSEYQGLHCKHDCKYWGYPLLKRDNSSCL